MKKEGCAARTSADDCSAPTVSEPTLSLRLVYILERNYWCLVRDGVWFRAASEIDIADLLSYLRAEIVSTTELNEFPAIMFRAGIEQINATECLIGFHDQSGDILAREVLRADRDGLVDVSWTSGSHADGWTELTAELEVEASGQLAFEVFLPTSELFDSKELIASANGAAAFRCEVPRGMPFKTPPIDLDKMSAVGLIRLATGYAERAPGDQRELGVLVTRVLLNDTPVVPRNAEFQ